MQRGWAIALGARVRNARKRAGITQAQLAAELDSSPSHVWRLETGRNPGVSVDFIARIAQVLAVDVIELLEDSPRWHVASTGFCGRSPRIERNVIELRHDEPGYNLAVVELRSGTVVLGWELVISDRDGSVLLYATFPERELALKALAES